MRILKAAAAPLMSALIGVAHAQPSPTHPAQHILSALQEITGVPGMSAAVSKDGEIIWSGQAGFMDIEDATPVTGETQFRLASVSKLFAAATALTLVADGRLDIDADIRTYVPDWPDHGGAKITVRQLAAHISGLSHYDSSDRYDPFNSYSTLDDSLSIYAHKPLLFEPGAAYNYSSYGYALMGAAIENVSGKSFSAYLDEAALKPLKLDHTLVEDVDDPPSAASALYNLDVGKIARNNQRHVVGATGILSTPIDLVTFADAYMNAEIVNADLVEMSLTPVRLSNGEVAGTARFQIGFGWRIGENWEGERFFHHSGATPGARSVLIHNPVRDVSAALLSNAQWTTRIETTGALLATAADEGAGLNANDCPLGDWRYAGVFIPDENNAPQTDNAHGVITMERRKNLCAGEIHPEGALASWLRERDSKTGYMHATLVAKRNSNLIFAVVTPWGAFPLQWSGNDEPASLNGDFAGRAVSLTMKRQGEAQ